ncbi:hypothetical protein DPMN_136617 [Dreissena polymorpha]|uniref:Uncharacterized protein n=1 Tax=Dreissena polymorpha TaxID=45954 RepID=A0A9D4JFP8_DREPO|nr:hypothetical protein DPMN_136617 [Dreissena polymorpha]
MCIIVYSHLNCIIDCEFHGKTAPTPWRPYINKSNLFTKFHDDWAKNVTSRVFTKNCPLPGSHVIQLTGIETNVLTKFHENWAKNVTSKVFTCFHYKHKDKNATPTGQKIRGPTIFRKDCTWGHVFSLIWTIFKLVRDINKTNVFTNFHDDWAKIVTFFNLNQDIIGTNVLTKFHKDRTKNVASRLFTIKYDESRPITKAHLSNQFHDPRPKHCRNLVLGPRPQYEKETVVVVVVVVLLE